ncbi:peptidase [Rhodobacterales bacterium HKCCE2091]|nr:peptidase [Rhodobacterales bacterium HKCCE2091]
MLRALNLHRWLGRILAIYLVFAFATGTLLVFSLELEALFSPQMQRQDAAAAPVSYGAMLDGAMAVYPEGRPLVIRAPTGFLATAIDMRVDGASRVVWVDPATGDVQGDTAAMGLHETLRLMHTQLMVNSKYALLLVTSVAFLLGAQLVAGLLSQRRVWRFALRRPSGPPRSAWGGLHRLAGLWALPVLTVTVLTGMFYFFEVLGFEPDTPAPAPVSDRAETLPADFGGADLDAAIALALAEQPDLGIEEIYLPINLHDSLRVRGDATALLVRPRANTVTVDPATLNVLGSFRGEDLSFGRRIAEAADPLHFGSFGGTLTRVIWFVSGCLAVLLVVAGLNVAAHTAGSAGTKSFRAALNAIFLPARVATAVAFVAVTVLLFARVI